jgi:hypothetical protein
MQDPDHKSTMLRSEESLAIRRGQGLKQGGQASFSGIESVLPPVSMPLDTHAFQLARFKEIISLYPLFVGISCSGFCQVMVAGSGLFTKPADMDVCLLINPESISARAACDQSVLSFRLSFLRRMLESLICLGSSVIPNLLG